MQARQKVNMYPDFGVNICIIYLYPDFGIHSNSIVPGGFEVKS